MDKFDGEKNEYRTKDLGEIATLFCMDAKYVRMERVDSVCWFIFLDIDFCWDISNRYFYGSLSVHPRVYYEVLSRLKTKIFANK